MSFIKNMFYKHGVIVRNRNIQNVNVMILVSVNQSVLTIVPMVISVVLMNMVIFSLLNLHITLCPNYALLALQMLDILLIREITKHIVLGMIGLKVEKHLTQFILLKQTN